VPYVFVVLIHSNRVNQGTIGKCCPGLYVSIINLICKFDLTQIKDNPQNQQEPQKIATTMLLLLLLLLLLIIIYDNDNNNNSIIVIKQQQK
jgi:hypothetical protein